MMETTPAALVQLFEGRRLLRPLIRTQLLNDEETQLLTAVGLPAYFGGWFRACQTIVDTDYFAGRAYPLGDRESIIDRAIVIARGTFGWVGIDDHTRCIVWVDDEETDYVNSDLRSLLYFMGSFLQSGRRRFDDIEVRRRRCEELDPLALADPEGDWSQMFDDASLGVYGPPDPKTPAMLEEGLGQGVPGFDASAQE